MSLLTRRKAVFALTALCSTLSSTRTRAAHPTGFRHIDLEVPGALLDARRAAVIVPDGLREERELGAVVLLHGFKSADNERRAVAIWRKDFGVERAHERLTRLPFEAEAKSDASSEVRAREIQRELEVCPFAGLVMICPRTVVPYYRPGIGKAYADWLVDELLPRVREVAPISPTRIALAGVSMGGRVGLEVMSERSEAFAGFVGLQCDMKRSEAALHAERLERAVAQNGARDLYFVSSTQDPYLEAHLLLAGELERRGLGHSLRVTTGNHTSAWVRSTGAIEALLRADRVVNHGAAALEAR